MEFIDLTGKKFNKLTAIKRVESKNKKVRYLWKCECGNEKEIEGHLVYSGKIKSCGCIVSPDLTGKTFGKLTVISFAESKNGKKYWLCKCSCKQQNERIVSTVKLNNGKITSCGCDNKTRLIDLTGQVFGRWTVLGRADSKNKKTMWYCQCSCGNKNIYTLDGNVLKKGDSKSCGCILREMCDNNFLGYGEAELNQVLIGYKRHAQDRNIDFNLTRDQFKEITKQNCYYCGSPPSQISRSDDNSGNYVYNGIDRVNNSVGYEIENCVPCCWTCNRMKREMTIESFTSHILKIVSN